MISKKIWFLFFFLIFSNIGILCAEASDADTVVSLPKPTPLVGSWTFSGMVTNESGDHYGYFFQMKRQGSDFHAQTALIDGQTNQLVLFYEDNAKIDVSESLNWQVGRSFIRYNPINDSWVFGLKVENEKGFNFKVDMLKQAKDNHSLVLRPGVELLALQTSRLNGHLQTGEKNSKEQFVTGNNAWFGKLWFSSSQKTAHDISTTFCRLSNDDAFYSANLKERDATGAAVGGWRDALGNKVKMSQFLSIKSLANNQCMLSLGVPKLNLKVTNTLKHEEHSPLSVAGFSKEQPNSFCFVTEQSFAKAQEAAINALNLG